MYKVVVVMLPVGQGGMNLIEVYNNNNTLINLSLIDCGGDDGAEESKQMRVVSLQYAAKKMRERWENARIAGYAYLDNLLLTHRDRDHWNLLKYLFALVKLDVLGSAAKFSFYNKPEEGGEEFYFLNKEAGAADAHLSYNDVCKIETYISYRMSEEGQNTTVNWEYSDGEIEIEGAWRYVGTVRMMHIDVYLIQGEEEKKNVLCIHELGNALLGLVSIESMYHIDIKIEKGKLNSPYSFMLEVYNAVIVPILKMPVKYIDKLIEMLKRIIINPAGIEKIIGENPCSGYPVITHTYVGGNDVKVGISFRPVMQMLRLITCEGNFYENGLDKKEVVLADGILLYFIKKTDVCFLSDLPGAEKVRGTSIKNNATSLVSALICTHSVPFQKVVFCGDATVHTFYQMLLEYEHKKIKHDYREAVWTAPHHGAYRTIIGNTLGWTADMRKPVFPLYLEKLLPERMVISAGVKNLHGHPCASFVMGMLNYFAGQRKAAEGHDIYVNKNNNRKSGDAHWTFQQCDVPLYTTYTRQEKDKYVAYVISCLEGTFHSEEMAHLLSAVRVAKAIPERMTPEMPPGLSKETEIPSGNLFIYR